MRSYIFAWASMICVALERPGGRSPDWISPTSTRRRSCEARSRTGDTKRPNGEATILSLLKRNRPLAIVFQRSSVRRRLGSGGRLFAEATGLSLPRWWDTHRRHIAHVNFCNTLARQGRASTSARRRRNEARAPFRSHPRQRFAERCTPALSPTSTFAIRWRNMDEALRRRGADETGEGRPPVFRPRQRFSECCTPHIARVNFCNTLARQGRAIASARAPTERGRPQRPRGETPRVRARSDLVVAALFGHPGSQDRAAGPCTRQGNLTTTLQDGKSSFPSCRLESSRATDAAKACRGECSCSTRTRV